MCTYVSLLASVFLPGSFPSLPELPPIFCSASWHTLAYTSLSLYIYIYIYIHTYICIYIYIYIYIQVYIYIYISLSLYIYMYIYIYTYIYIHIYLSISLSLYIYIYIHIGHSNHPKWHTRPANLRALSTFSDSLSVQLL